jgi:hypothetical protein
MDLVGTMARFGLRRLGCQLWTQVLESVSQNSKCGLFLSSDVDLRVQVFVAKWNNISWTF